MNKRHIGLALLVLGAVVYFMQKHNESQPLAGNPFNTGADVLANGYSRQQLAMVQVAGGSASLVDKIQAKVPAPLAVVLLVAGAALYAWGKIGA